MYDYEKPDNLAESLHLAVSKYADNKAIGTKTSSGDYDWVTYKELGRRVDNFRGGLASVGIGKDDFVGVICSNRVEWVVAAYSTYGRQARFVPMYEQEVHIRMEIHPHGRHGKSAHRLHRSYL